MRIREALLQVIQEKSRLGPGSFQSRGVLEATVDKLGIRHDHSAQQALLTIWHDMFRTGVIAPGSNFMNPDLPFLHLTEIGRKTLENVSRDPANPEGYIAYLRTKCNPSPIAMSYISEGLKAYNATCFKSAAVMVGAATERLVLDLRDELVAGLTRQNVTSPKNLNDWRYKTVRDAITTTIDAVRTQLTPNRLQESYSAYWTSLTEQPRLTRNDAGHPTSLDPVEENTVHAGLLVFPEIAALCGDLTDWIKGHYV